MSSDARPSRRHLAAWALTWVAYATYYMGRKGFSVTKRTLEQTLGLSRAELGLIDTAYLASYALGQFVNGVLGDRIGARWLVGPGMLLSALACTLFGASSGVWAFLVLFLINGYAQSTGWPGTTRAMTEWTTPENRGSVMGFWSTCYQIGGVAATALAGWLVARHGWRSAFFVPALILALVGVAVLAWLRPGPGLEPPAPAAGATAAPTSDRPLAQSSRSLFLSPELWSYGLSYFCIKLIRYSLLFWLPYFLAQALGYTDENAAYTSLAFELGGTAGVVVVGALSDRVRWSRAAVSAACLVALALALFVYKTLLFQLAPGSARDLVNLAGLALIGAALFAPDSLLSGAAAQDIGGMRGAATATGFVNGMGSVGAILQGYVTAQVSERYGWEALFTVFVALAALSLVALLPMLSRRRGAASTKA
jgi:sugar phosphate permease